MITIAHDRAWIALVKVAAVAFASVVAACGGGGEKDSGQVASAQGMPDSTAQAQAAKSKARVVWGPEVLHATVLQGTAQLSSIELTVNEQIDDASLFVVPEIAGLMQVSLLGQTLLSPGLPINAAMQLSIPASTAPGLYEGTVHVRSGARTVPATLKVQIQVVSGSSDQVVNRVTDPSPDRITHLASGQPLIRDELVVVLKGDVADPIARIKEVATQASAVIVGSIPNLFVYQLRVPGAEPGDLQIYADLIRSLVGVRSVSRHFLGEPLATWPDDKPYATEWNTTQQADGINRHLEFIDAPAAWDITTGRADPFRNTRRVRVAVLDKEFDWEHPDLVGNVINHPSRLWLKTFGNRSSANFDPHVGHGTMVAGAICAHGNNEIGVMGVAWNCTLDLYDLRGILVSPSLPSHLISPVKLADAMRQAIDNFAQVVNISYAFVNTNCGQGVPTPACLDDVELIPLVVEVNDIIEPAIEYSETNSDTRKRNVLWVLGAGNEHRSAALQSPASLVARHADRIIVVAAADIPDGGPIGSPSTAVQITGFSNYGRWVDVAAPNPVTTTFPRVCEKPAGCDDVSGETVASWPQYSSYKQGVTGTSIAAPQVAGLAALVLSKHHDKTPKEVKDCIVNAANMHGAKVNLPGGIYSGFNVINAVKAVECAPPAAGTLTFVATGKVTQLSDPLNLLHLAFQFPVSLGDSVIYEYTFRMDARDANPGDPNEGVYLIESISMKIGNNEPILKTTDVDLPIIVITYNHAVWPNRYYVAGHFVSVTSCEIVQSICMFKTPWLFLSNPRDGYISSDALFQPDISAFGSGFFDRYMQLTIQVTNDNRYSGILSSIETLVSK